MTNRSLAGAAAAVVCAGAAATAPAAAQNAEGTAEINGARIHYKAVGRGTPMLLIHGYPLNGELFAANRAALVRAGFRVITYDQRGFGKSAAPENKPGDIPTYAQDALGLMDKLNVRKAVVGGMSMGGAVAFEMYRRAPERFAGLVLISTLANPANPAEKGVWKGARDQATANGVASLVPVLVKDMLTGRTRADRPAVVAATGALIKQASLRGAVAGADALASRPDSLPTLPTIRVPTLILVGLEDTVYPPPFAQKMRQNIRGSKLVVIPGASHGAIFEAAPAANRAIADWARGLK